MKDVRNYPEIKERMENCKDMLLKAMDEASDAFMDAVDYTDIFEEELKEFYEMDEEPPEDIITECFMEFYGTIIRGFPGTENLSGKNIGKMVLEDIDKLEDLNKKE